MSYVYVLCRSFAMQHEDEDEEQETGNTKDRKGRRWLIQPPTSRHGGRSLRPVPDSTCQAGEEERLDSVYAQLATTWHAAGRREQQCIVSGARGKEASMHYQWCQEIRASLHRRWCQEKTD